MFIKNISPKRNICFRLQHKNLGYSFSDIINFNNDYLIALIEARYYMETTTVRLAVIRRTANGITGMEEALDDFTDKGCKGQEVVQEDMLFHIKVAGDLKNLVIDSLIPSTIPDVKRNIREHELCGKEV